MAAKVEVYKGFNGAADTAARIVGDSAEMTALAHPVLATAKALAARHIETGHYLSSFGIDKIPGKRGVTDRAVFNSDPQAHIIEDGHLQFGRAADGQPTVRFVEGLHILRRAAKLTPRIR